MKQSQIEKLLQSKLNKANFEIFQRYQQGAFDDLNRSMIKQKKEEHDLNNSIFYQEYHKESKYGIQPSEIGKKINLYYKDKDLAYYSEFLCKLADQLGFIIDGKMDSRQVARLKEAKLSCTHIHNLNRLIYDLILETYHERKEDVVLNFFNRLAESKEPEVRNILSEI